MDKISISFSFDSITVVVIMLIKYNLKRITFTKNLFNFVTELARKTGLGLRRKSIRMSFDTFMSKSRPGNNNMMHKKRENLSLSINYRGGR